MGLMNVLMNYGKARVAGRLLQRGLGGRVGTLFLVAWAGKKAYQYMQSRRRPVTGKHFSY
jgi:hypothetical protein